MSVTVAACAVALLLQCALLLVSLFATLNTVLALVLLFVVELVPGLVLVIVLRQPRQLDGWRDLVWCFFLRRIAGSSSTDSSDSGQIEMRLPSSGSSGSARFSGTV